MLEARIYRGLKEIVIKRLTEAAIATLQTCTKTDEPLPSLCMRCGEAMLLDETPLAKKSALVELQCQ